MMAQLGREGKSGAYLANNHKGAPGNAKTNQIPTQSANGIGADDLTNLANWALQYKPLGGMSGKGLHSEPPSLHGSTPDAPGLAGGGDADGEGEVYEKPPCSYACLITWAIRDAEGERIKLEGIYTWIMD
eukprot:gene23333-24340_t